MATYVRVQHAPGPKTYRFTDHAEAEQFIEEARPWFDLEISTTYLPEVR